jgi:SAM-dependent methyltransferase
VGDEGAVVRRDLLAYYDDEAATGARRPVSGYRVELRDRFVELLVGEGRRSVLDIGAGPGSDAAGFTDAGITYRGIDLAPANAALAKRSGHDVLAASLFDLPFPRDLFDAGWSMSTMMHVPDGEAVDALREIVRPLVSGAPLAVGSWGGSLGEIVSTKHDDESRRRLFCLRTWEQNRELLEEVGTIEHHEVWETGAPGWEYQFAIVRVA